MSNARGLVGVESLDVVTLVVDDQEEALAFYTETLGFETRSDEEFVMEGETGRWLTVGLPGQELEISLVSVAPYYDEDTAEILEEKRGTQTWWTFGTEDCEASVAAMESAGVEITQAPREYPWGTEAMFADPFGNEFGLMEYAA